MNSETIAALIGVATFVLTLLGNAIVLGMFLGGMRAEMRVTSDRLAKIEGMFTLVPRSQDSVGKTLSLGMVRMGHLLPNRRRYPNSTKAGQIYSK